MTTLLDKIDALKGKFIDDADAQMIQSWETDAKKNLITANLGEHEALKFIITKIDEEIASINEVLLESDSTQLPDKERDTFIRAKKFYQRFKSIFDIAKSNIAAIESEVDSNLKEE